LISLKCYFWKSSFTLTEKFSNAEKFFLDKVTKQFSSFRKNFFSLQKKKILKKKKKFLRPETRKKRKCNAHVFKLECASPLLISKYPKHFD